MQNFCTLFNINYLSRGLAMYFSLKEFCPDFHLYIFPFDDITANYFSINKLPNITIVLLADFEDDNLLAVKSSRSNTEYCWTCTPSIIFYCFEKYNLQNCTYLDADLFFFSNPKILIDEMGDNSVLITEHRYTPKYDQTIESGIYCVQFVTFKNDLFGIKVLKWWRDACIDWCFAKPENGKFGDQKYLDDWITRFENVHVSKNLGAGVAPWNVQQYKFYRDNSGFTLKEISTGFLTPLIFYHFHGMKFFNNDVISLTSNHYQLNQDVKNILYKKYISFLMSIILKKENNIIYENTFNSKEFFNGKIISQRMLLKKYLADLKISPLNIFGKSIINYLKTYHYYKINTFFNKTNGNYY